MEPGVSIQIIWPLAAEEAIAGEFEYIEPSHLFNALLKFTELENGHFERMSEDHDVVKILVEERDAARYKLADHNISVPESSTAIRRALRERLGRGVQHVRRHGEAIHRSDAAREACTAAEDVARMAGARHWEAVHLLSVLLKDPGTRMVSVLAEFEVASSALERETPLLDLYGRDLTALAHAGSNIASETSLSEDPVCKVVTEKLLGPSKRNIVLIQAGKRTPEEVIEKLAALFTSNNPPKSARSKRIIEIDLTRLADGTTDTEEIVVRMDALLGEAADVGNIILWLSAAHRYFAVGHPGLLKVLEQGLNRLETPIIGSMGATGYSDYLKGNPGWKKMFHIVWIHDVQTVQQL